MIVTKAGKQEVDALEIKKGLVVNARSKPVKATLEGHIDALQKEKRHLWIC